jgi:hypothetical protein
MVGTYSTPENREWRKARRSAFIQDILGSLSQRPADLLSFEHVHQKLRLNEPQPAGLQDVPLDQIVGSVGRYADFTRFFFPRQENLQERWQRIEQLHASGRELPPIVLYQVGQVYFVHDGNHRVSVARQHGASSLKAIVWKYETSIPLDPNSDLDDLLCRAAHAAFVERTHLDRLRPDLPIQLSQPGAYDDLLREIEAQQQIFARIDRREVSGDEATALWYDLRYTPVVEIIRHYHILQHFPGLTEADLYLWLCRNRQELEASYGQQIYVEQAARELARRFGQNLLVRRITPVVGRLTGIVATWASERQRAPRPARR